MSELYERSRLEKYQKYFSGQNEFEKGLGKYFMESGQVQGVERYGTGAGGVPLSYDSDKRTLRVDDSDAHTLVIGATGSKKSRLIAMPTVKILSAAKESMIIADPKAEIYQRCVTDLKQNGYDVYSINLREPQLGEGWNPLSRPYQFFCSGNKDLAYEFANDITVNLAESIVAHNDPFWGQTASSFLFGLIMLLFQIGKEFGFAADKINIWNIIKLRSYLCEDLHEFRMDLDIPKINYAKKDAFIYSLLRGTIETADVTRRGILTHFDQTMRTFSIQPKLMAMLADDDGILERVQQKPTAIFLIVPDEKTSYHNLVSLFIKQSYEYFIFRVQKSKENLSVRVNYILDEFSSLPTVKDFPTMITAARSRNIRFNLFIQSKHQLDLRYTEESHTIRANCNNWIFLVSRELSLLQELSELSGTRYFDNKSRPVISVSDLQHLDKEKGEVLIFSGRKKPYLVRLPDIDDYGLTAAETPIKQKIRNLETIDFSCYLDRGKHGRRRNFEFLKDFADDIVSDNDNRVKDATKDNEEDVDGNREQDVEAEDLSTDVPLHEISAKEVTEQTKDKQAEQANKSSIIRRAEELQREILATLDRTGRPDDER